MKGFEVIYQKFHDHFLRPGAPKQLNHQSGVQPLTPGIWVRMVLSPEVALQLIAEDLRLPVSDAKVEETLEASREYGMAVFPAGEDEF